MGVEAMARFAANLSMMYTEFPFLDRFAAASRDGFKAVEYLFPFDYEAKDLADLLSDNGLEQVLFNAPPGDWLAGERGLACLPSRQTEFCDGIRRALDYAHFLSCPRVHVMAGIIPSGADRVAVRGTYLSNLAWATDQAEEAGKELLIEPINLRDMPGYLLNRQDDAHAIVAEIGSPNLKVQFDLYHCQIVEGDVATKLKKYLEDPKECKVGHIQVAGVPERHEPDSGELNYDYLLDLIDALGFDRWIGCEYRPRAGTSEGLGWLRRRLSPS
jgi:hydroxypyruvate isomerase